MNGRHQGNSKYEYLLSEAESAHLQRRARRPWIADIKWILLNGVCDASRIRYRQVRTIPTDTRCVRDIMMTMRSLTTASFATIWVMVATPCVIADEIGQLARLSVGVTDRDGQPVGDVVIYATKNSVDDDQRPHPITAVMDQIDTNFVPHILIAQAGALIEFPNSDNISHHVYSFSEARPLELPLYKGTTHPPLLFDVPGLVILGCNIHDDMLGYIIVVDLSLIHI